MTNFIQKIICIIFSIIFFSYANFSFAQIYNPGETLDPSCGPTDLNCGVKALVDFTTAELTGLLPVANGGTGVSSFNSDNVQEGSTNLFFTSARFNSIFSAKTTSDLTEGSNLYFTNQRAVDAVGTPWTSMGYLTSLNGAALLTGSDFSGAISTTQITTPIIYGSSSASGNLTLSSTSHVTKGKILFGTSAYDEVNNYLGIGTATPNSLLEINGALAGDNETLFLKATSSSSANTIIKMGKGSTRYAYIQSIGGSNANGNSNQLAFGVNESGNLPVEAMRIKSTGNIVIGATNERSVVLSGTSITPRFQIEGTSANTASQSIIRNSNDGAGARINLGKTRGTAIGGINAVQSGDILGDISFLGSDGTDIITGASVRGVANGIISTGNMPTDLALYTTSATNVAERMRITSDGRVGIGTSTPNNDLELVQSVNADTSFKIRNDSIISSRTASLKFGITTNSNDSAAIRVVRNSSTDFDMIFSRWTGSSVDTMTLSGAGNVGIGFTDPTSILEINSSSSSPTATGIGINGSFQVNRVNGTRSSPTKVLATNLIGAYQFGGQYDATVGHVTTGAYIGAIAADDWSTVTAKSTDLVFTTSPASGSLAERFRITNSGVVRPGADNSQSLGTASFRWSAVYATNGTIQTSDRSLKTNINNLNYGLKELLGIKPVQFDWIDGKGHSIGFIAQDMKNIIPEIVFGEEGSMGINYAGLAPVLVQGIQDLNTKIDNITIGSSTGIVYEESKKILVVDKNTELTKETEVVMCKNIENILLTLPNALDMKGKEIVIKLLENNQVMINTVGSQTIDGEEMVYFQDKYEKINLISDGENWYKI